MVSDLLTEELYDAGRSGLHWSIAPPSVDRCRAIVVTVGGFHHKLGALLRRICEALPSMLRRDNADFAAAFARAHDEASRAVRSFAVEGPRAHIADARSRLLLPHYIAPAAMESALAAVTADSLLDFAAQLWSPPATLAGPAPPPPPSPSYRCLVYGNVDAASAAAMVRDAAATADAAFARNVEAAVGGAAAGASGTASAAGSAASSWPAFAVPRALLPPPRSVVVVTKPHPNVNEVNAAVAITYLVDGVRTPRTMALASLLSMLLSHATFDTLRTKQQLGYIVASDTQVFARTAVGITIVVQSSVASVAVLEARMDAFVATVEEAVLAAVSDAELEERKAVLAARLLEPPKTQGAEFAGLDEAVSRLVRVGVMAEFHRDEATAAAVRAVTKASLVQFARDTLDAASPRLRKVVVRVYARNAGGGGGGGAGSGGVASASSDVALALLGGGPTAS